MRIRRGPASSRCWEPVTVPAAPRNVSVALTGLPTLRMTHARGPDGKHPCPGRKVEDLFGGGIDAGGHEGRDIESGLRHHAFFPAHARPRVLRNEERAAVRVGLDGDLEGPERARLVGDLDLVHADERTEDRQGPPLSGSAGAS